MVRVSAAMVRISTNHFHIIDLTVREGHEPRRSKLFTRQKKITGADLQCGKSATVSVPVSANQKVQPFLLLFSFLRNTTILF